MTFPAVLLPLAGTAVDLAVRVADETPKDEDVKAGWLALVIFLLLGAAVVVLAFSLVKQLRKAQAAEDAGIYGSDEPDPAAGAEAEPENHSAS
ncbi:hypothetical protein [Nocardioides halotolerans]|uniref:hypothetical protein n=1 Tax=Nocardioides halotolerans TaxID=433660 RepID=UPI0012F799C3|nr:hypothetical protein [Nocardioides halotolerans]